MSDERLQQQNQQRRHNCCRLCLAPDNECISILNSYAADKEPLASKIHSCVSIKVSWNTRPHPSIFTWTGYISAAATAAEYQSQTRVCRVTGQTFMIIILHDEVMANKVRLGWILHVVIIICLRCCRRCWRI